MSATQSGDFAFEPKVWGDHIRAYFDRKLVWGAMASIDDTLKPDVGAGETVNMPFFKKIGDVEEPAEDAGLVVDKLQDDSFSCTVKEVGKAVGIKKKAFKVSAARTERIISEIQSQMGRVHAEKVDKDLIAEQNGAGNYTSGYLATAAANTMNIRTMLRAMIVAFGDKHDDTVAVFMHSLQFLDLMTDTTAGFLNADASDPMNGIDGFKGRLLGKAIIVADTCPSAGTIDGKAAYHAFALKANPYGICVKQDMEVEKDYDILAREWVFTSNEWYGVKSFHAEVSADDKRACRITTTVSV
jgi:hypothetical protein